MKHVHVQWRRTYNKLKFHFAIFLFLVECTESVKAVNPFIDRIPPHEHEEYFDDYVQLVSNMRLILDDRESDEDGCRIIVPYKLLVVYARK